MKSQGSETMEINDTTTGADRSFSPSRAVVISELSKDVKEHYYNLILTNNVKLQYTDNQFVANIRLIAPASEDESGYAEQKKEISPEGTERTIVTPPTATKKCNSSLPLDQRIHRLQYGAATKPLTFQIAGVAHFDYSTFPRFCSLIGDNNDVVRPQLRSVSWLMRMVEDIYDARFAHEKSHVMRKEQQKLNRDRSSGITETIEEEGDLSFSNSFPVFVVQRLTTVIGLRGLTDQTCWDLLCNIDRNYKDFLEIETFKFFLQEKFGDEDLLFFLYLRSIISKTLRVNFSGRWTLVHGPERQPRPLFITYQECVQISHKLFGASYGDMGRDFLLSLVTSRKLVGRVSRREDSRRIEVRDLLYLAVLGYHKAQSIFEQTPSDEAAAAESLSKYKAGRMKILANARSIELEQRRSDLNNIYRVEGISRSNSGERPNAKNSNIDINLNQGLKDKVRAGVRSSGGGRRVPSLLRGVPEGDKGDNEGKKDANKVQHKSSIREKEKGKAVVKAKAVGVGKEVIAIVAAAVCPPSPSVGKVTASTQTQTQVQIPSPRYQSISEKYREINRTKESARNKEEREAEEERQERANARAIILKINEALKTKPPTKAPIPSEQNERRTSWEQYNEAIGASERSQTPPPRYTPSAQRSQVLSMGAKGLKPFSSPVPAAGGYLDTNDGVSSSSSSSSGKSYDANDREDLELNRMRARQRVTVQPRISSESLLRNRESSVSAARRERRKSEICVSLSADRRLSGGKSGSERRFSVDSGDARTRRGSDCSITSIDPVSDAKKRFSRRSSVSSSSPSSGIKSSSQKFSPGSVLAQAQDYSFSEIYDVPASMEGEQDVDKSNMSVTSYEEKNTNPYTGTNSPLKRLRPPPLATIAPFAPRAKSPPAIRTTSPPLVPPPPPVIIPSLTMTSASASSTAFPSRSPKASATSKPSLATLIPEPAPNLTPKSGPFVGNKMPLFSKSSTSPKAKPPSPNRTTPSMSRRATSPVHSPNTPKGHNSNLKPTIPSPAILKTVPPPPPSLTASGLTASGLRRLSFRLLNQNGENCSPETVLGALSGGKPRSPRASLLTPQEQTEEASFTKFFSPTDPESEGLAKLETASRNPSPRSGAETMPPRGVVMREVMAISQRNTPKNSDSSHTPRLSGTPKRFSFITSNLFGPDLDTPDGVSEDQQRSDSYLSVPEEAVTAALAQRSESEDLEDQADAESERLGALRTQLEEELLEGACGALKGSGFTPSIAEVITDEISLLIHLKINDLFGDEEIADIDRDTVNKRIIEFFRAEREALSAALEERVGSMVQFVKVNTQQ